MREPLIYTFYRLSTFFITDSYPVDPNLIENEIVNPKGKIGTSFYKQYDIDNDSKSMENLVDYNNEWFMKIENIEVCEHLINDLLNLATNHNYGAYTLLASLTYKKATMTAYFKKAAEGGNREGMVSYGMYLCMDHKVKKGWKWILKGADLGEDAGLLIAAVSYHYGTFSNIDLNKAAHYYRLMIKEKVDNSYSACINLGTMYVEANYFHTAMKFFKLAEEHKEKDAEKIKGLSLQDMFKNIEYCEKLLLLPATDRPKRSMVQYQSPYISKHLCTNRIAPPIGVDLSSLRDIEPWQPDDIAEIVPKDIEEHRELDKIIKLEKTLVSPHEDFIFTSIPVEIHNDRIFGNQKEFVFLEKYAHAELNMYIQRNLPYLKNAFRKHGLVFYYIPAKDYEDFNEMFECIIPTYEEESVDLALAFMLNKERSEYKYWNSITSEKELPHDCAGFLHYIPQRSNKKQKKKLYDYILFPYLPGTNWEKAFACFIDYAASLPYVDARDIFAENLEVIIDEKYNVRIHYQGEDDFKNDNNKIKMPILSKVLYFVFLNHQEGIYLKDLVDYKEELLYWYKKLSNRKNIDKSIDDLVNPVSNSVNEKISRIRKAFEMAMLIYPKEAVDSFVPMGKKGGKYKVTLERDRVVWKKAAEFRT